jgi:hypoxanthine phosphoribosyltransferase
MLCRLASRARPEDPADMTDERLRPLIPAVTIEARVAELGASITRDYAGQELVLVCVLKGSFVFCADLARAIALPLRVEFLGVRSYGDATESSGVVEITHDLSRAIDGEHVLVVEDIVDSGLTSAFLLRHLGGRAPASVKLCTLLHKPARARRAVPIDYLGFTIDDHFVVGYGLDHAQRHRNLRDVCVLDDPEA